MRLLRRPLVGLLVGLLAGLVIVPFSGYGFGSVATNLWWAAFTELPFLFVIWRYWGTWMHYVGAVVVGVVETDGGDAITVAVTQRRRIVKGKYGSISTFWDEKRREVVARPFRVMTSDGRAVRADLGV